VNAETELLLRYLDGEMSPGEAQSFRARLAESPAMRQELREMQRVGVLVREWAGKTEQRAGDLVGPTLRRVEQTERARVRYNTLGYVLAAALSLALPWSKHTPLVLLEPAVPKVTAPPAAAAIERVEAHDQRAQVFVVNGSSTPVVWLSDDVQDDDDSSDEQDPG
jgi:anti-sigma factor RsiW